MFNSCESNFTLCLSRLFLRRVIFDCPFVFPRFLDLLFELWSASDLLRLVIIGASKSGKSMNFLSRVLTYSYRHLVTILSWYSHLAPPKKSFVPPLLFNVISLNSYQVFLKNACLTSHYILIPNMKTGIIHV